MWSLALVFVSGLLGSGHCIGMCGPFAVAIGAASGSWRVNFSRQLAYTAGRVATYGLLGALVAFGGVALAHKIPGATRLPGLLSLAAGVLLLIQAAYALHWIRWWPRMGGETLCRAASLFGEFFRQPGWSGAFVAGVFTGFLPCGLTYAFLTSAAGAGNIFLGAGTMVAFGLGTLPVMVATGLGGSWLRRPAQRKRVFALAGYAVLLAGALSLARGVWGLRAADPLSTQACPMCASEH